MGSVGPARISVAGFETLPLRATGTRPTRATRPRRPRRAVAARFLLLCTAAAAARGQWAGDFLPHGCVLGAPLLLSLGASPCTSCPGGTGQPPALVDS